MRRPSGIRWLAALLLLALSTIGVIAWRTHASTKATSTRPATTVPVSTVHRTVTRPPAVRARPVPPVQPARRIHARRAAMLHLPARLPQRRVDLLVLMYHRIDRTDPRLPAITQALTVSPAAFASEMGWIASHGGHTVTQLQVWNALMHGRPLPHAPVLVTFDDAYRDVVTYAAPVIRRHHQHATAYVITDRLSHGRKTLWMTWSQLRILQRDGFDIGSHTVSHADLVTAGAARARSQLRGSRFALQRYLDHPVQWLAYPYGMVDPAVERLAQQAGYVLAVTTSSGLAQDADAPLLLHRYEVTDTTGVRGVAALLADE